MGHLGGILEASWDILGMLEASWRQLGGILEASWRHLGGILGHLGMSYELLKVFFVIFDVPNLLFLRDSSSEMLTLKKSESIKKTFKNQ